MSNSFNNPLKHMRDNQRRMEEQSRRASQKAFDDFSKRSREQSQRNFDRFVEQNRKRTQDDMMRRQAEANRRNASGFQAQNQTAFSGYRTHSDGTLRTPDSLLNRSERPNYAYQPDTGTGCFGALVRVVGILVILGIAAFVVLMVIQH